MSRSVRKPYYKYKGHITKEMFSRKFRRVNKTLLHKHEIYNQWDICDFSYNADWWHKDKPWAEKRRRK